MADYLGFSRCYAPMFIYKYYGRSFNVLSKRSNIPKQFVKKERSDEIYMSISFFPYGDF